MKTICKAIIALAAVAAALSCQRDPIEYPTSNYYLAVRVNLSGAGTVEPSVYAVNFYDPSTHRLVLQSYIYANLHPDGLPMGGYVHGIEPGIYDLVVYNFDTRVTSVANGDYFNGMYCFTGTNAYSDNTPITYAPDHLYVYSGRVNVPYITEADGIYYIETELESVVENWRVIVEGVKRLETATDIMFYLSGQCRGWMLGTRERVNENVIVMFPGTKGAATKGDGDTVIDTRYTTFGKLDGDRRVMMTFVIGGPNGSTYYGQEDVTDQVIAQQDGDRTIRISSDIEIKPRIDGGFNPEAKPWDPRVTVIDLE